MDAIAKDEDPTTLLPVPVVVLSGFLGSGKTTLLNALLAAPHGEKIAVIVNEFGEIGIDGALIEGASGFVELDNGCLCCALNEDLQEALRAIVARGGIDRIIIETTGLADPLPVAWTCTKPGLAQALRLDAIVTLVAADSGANTLATHREARLQVERADVLVESKRDLAADGGAAARAAARGHNPHAPWLLGADVLHSWRAFFGISGDAIARASAASASVTHAHHHDEQAAQPHDDHEHDAPHGAMQTVSWQRPLAHGPIDERLAETLAFAIPDEVVRFKGLLHVAAPEGPWLLVHGVGGRIDLRFVVPARPPQVNALVFFGFQLDGEALRQLCAKHLGV